MEQKTCVHCGGPTSAPGSIPMAFSTTTASDATGMEPMRAPEPLPAWGPEGGVSDGPAGLGGFGSDASEGRAEAAHEVEVEAPPQSPMRRMMNSLGGLVWILIVVLYSLAQSCGE